MLLSRSWSEIFINNSVGPNTSFCDCLCLHMDIMAHAHRIEREGSSPLDEEFCTLEYPPKPSPIINLQVSSEKTARQAPLQKEEFNNFIDADGRLINEHEFRKAVFKGGVDNSIRKDVWKFLFHLYPCNTTEREREILAAENRVKYAALKNRWKQTFTEDSELKTRLNPAYLRSDSNPYDDPNAEVDLSITQSSEPIEEVKSSGGFTTPEVKQQLQFAQIQAQVYAQRQPLDVETLRNCLRVIDKDVPRTDRKSEYFKGSGNPHLTHLREILISYAAYHPHVNYAQGMNDYVALFLTVFDSEVEAYFCFENYMNTMEEDFMEEGLFNKLKHVRQLLQDVDADLVGYLDELQVGDMAFCHRWMLLSFKREFNHQDAMRCFEILSSHHLELSCIEAERARDEERRKEFETQDGRRRTESSPVNNDLTFDIFMCVTILLDHRDNLFRCKDTCEVFQYICKISAKLILDEILTKAEAFFFKYCQKSATDCFEMVDLPLSNGAHSPSN